MASRVIGELVVKIKGDGESLRSTLKNAESMNDQFTRKLLSQSGNRLQLLNLDRQKDLAAARKLGADTTKVSQYYNNEQTRLLKEAHAKRLDAIGKVGNRMSLAITAPLAILGGVIMKYVGEMEMLQTSFEVMLQSADKAASLMGDLKQMAATTPFETTQLANASKLLLQYGVAVEDLIPTMKMLGDISSGDAQKFSSLGLVMGQIRALGRLTGQDLRQMVGVGFNPLYAISEKTGESMASLTDKMSKGLITYDMVAESMRAATSEGGKFYQGMEKGSKTLQGLLSTLKDDAMEAGRTLLEGFLPAIKDIVKFISSLAQGLNEMTPGMKGFILGMLGILAAIGPVAKGIQLFSKGLDVLKKHPAILIIAGLVTLFLALKGAIEDAATVNGRMADSLEDERKEAEKLVSRFNELNDKVDKNTDEKNELLEVELELKKRFGETAVAIDKETGALILNNAAIAKGYRENVVGQIKYQQAQFQVAKNAEKNAEIELAVAKHLSKQKLTIREQELLNTEKAQNLIRAGQSILFADESTYLDQFIKKQDEYNKAKQARIDADEELIRLGGILMDINDPSRADARNRKEQEAAKIKAEQLAIEEARLKKEKEHAEWLAKTAKERNDINREYLEKNREATMSRLELLDIEMNEELAKARKVGADTKAIAEYYEREKEKAITEINEENANIRDRLRQEEEEKEISSLEFRISLYEAFATTAMNQLGDVFSSLGEALVTGEKGWASFGRAAVGAVSAIIEALGHQFIAKAGGALADALIALANPFTAWMAPGYFAAAAQYGVAGAGAMLAAGIVKGLASTIKLGTGGIVMPQAGGVPAILAERGTPEVVIPDQGNVWRQIGDRIARYMGRPINNEINNQVNLPQTMMVNIGGNEFMGFLTQASRDGRFLVDQKHGISKRG